MDDFSVLYPEITLETEDMVMTIVVKKSYAEFTDMDERKKEFIKDLNEFIKEFSETQEASDFISYCD